VQLPRSRVNGADRKSYSVVFTTHVYQEAVEGLQKVMGGIRAPLGILHGYPCHLCLAWQEEPDAYSLSLHSRFLHGCQDTALDGAPGAPAWMEVDDRERGFEFTLVRATIGQGVVQEARMHTTRVGTADLLFTTTAESLVYDAAGKLEVQIELQVTQERNCGWMRVFVCLFVCV